MYVRFFYWARRPRSSKMLVLIEQIILFFAITIEIIAYPPKASNIFLIPLKRRGGFCFRNCQCFLSGFLGRNIL
jgi:hypothetical protein